MDAPSKGTMERLRKLHEKRDCLFAAIVHGHSVIDAAKDLDIAANELWGFDPDLAKWLHRLSEALKDKE
jgi:hypothetical protein